MLKVIANYFKFTIQFESIIGGFSSFTALARNNFLQTIERDRFDEKSNKTSSEMQDASSK
jgi:ABC-type microcin C transport system permease subunit YejB